MNQTIENNPTEPAAHNDNPDTMRIAEDRYSRLRLIGWWDQQRVRGARILVVGAGALGNEVLKNLVLLGIGTIDLVDFDTVQESNLSRSVLFRSEHAGQSKAQVAAKMARDLNPDCRILPIDGNILTDVGLGLVRDVNLVICCVDNREARLWINRMCWKTGTPWIDGGIQEISGVAKVFVPPDGACYECAMTENDYRLIALRYSCPLLRQEDIQQGKIPTAPTIASIIGGLQVQETLKLLHELPSAAGTALVFNGAANNFYQTKYPHREDCLSHETWSPIIDSPIHNQNTADELFSWIAQNFLLPDTLSLKLILDRDFLEYMECRSCELEKPIGKPRCQVDSSAGTCVHCNQPMVPRSISEIESGSPPASKPLKQLGIPVHDIVKISGHSDEYFISLSETGK